MLGIQNDDDMVNCPYNKTHMLHRKRLQLHLIKCRTQHPNAELQQCPFNTTHMIPEPEFTIHVLNCEDRKLTFDYNRHVSTSDDRPKQDPVECDENWDNTDVNDYNPEKYVATIPVLRNPNNISREINTESERTTYIQSKLNNAKLPTEISREMNNDSVEVVRPPPPPIISNWHEATSRSHSPL